MNRSSGVFYRLVLCDLYCFNLSCGNEVLVSFSMERFEEKIRVDSRFNVNEIGEVSLSKRIAPKDYLDL